MCGIAGLIHFDGRGVNPNHIINMMKTMKHRGPDDEGVFTNENCGLGHVRLSIIDLSPSGHQPMADNSGRYTIVFNGEIFNYLEIKKELEGKYLFKTSSDTEVILASYIVWGEKCLNKFNGMWAFAIYDKVEKSTFISRDRFGVKPLYYYQTENLFAFASEIKALYHLFRGVWTIDYTTVYDYLVFNRTDQTCNTFISQIKRLEHGHSVTLSSSGVKIKQWYSLEENINKPEVSHEEYLELLQSAVGLRLRSDVPVGVCLSGGIDSSSVTSIILDKFGINDLYTFSAIYGKGVRGDESGFINLYKPKLKNLIYIEPTEKTFIDDFSGFMDCHFEPVPSLSIYSQFKVLKDASTYVKVCLDGQGADEELAGYLYFFGSYFRELVNSLRFNKLQSEIFHYLHNHTDKTGLIFFLYYLLPDKLKQIAAHQKLGWMNADFIQQYQDKSQLIHNLYNPPDLKTSLLQHFQYKLEHNLKWNDLNSMYFSVEMRTPFLDYKLVESTFSLKSDRLIHKGYNKWILRESMKGLLPEQIRMRKDKVGFENPSEEWMKTVLMKTLAEEALNSSPLKELGVVDIKKCWQQYNLHQQKKTDISHDIWKWINLDFFIKNMNTQFPGEYFLNESIQINPRIGNYVIITPAKDEATHIIHTLTSVVSQKLLPKKWIIVDDGSVDSTPETVNSFIKQYPWISLVRIPAGHEKRSGGAKVVNAFNKGYEKITDDDFDVIVKLDSDLDLPVNYFESVMQSFADNAKLGLCGGYCINKYFDDFIPERSASYHVRGAFKAVRKKCFEEIGGFKSVWNWDGLDEMEAMYLGWQTQTLDIPVKHLRPTSTAYDPLIHAYKSGVDAYSMRNAIPLTIIRALFRIIEKPYFIRSAKYLQGYFSSMLKREKRIISPELGRFINRFHYNRILKRDF